ncbi:MAG: response regulator [Candidatus Thiodiazotropha sp. (ex Ctena orbiculata)]|nr:response regulator [Candidatus Thiodiazotropha taylori]
MIQLITIRKPYHLPLHLHGPLVVFDQIYLGVMTLSGLPVYLTLPLSGLLLFMTRSLGVSYVLIAIPVTFATVLYSLIAFSGFQLNAPTAIIISLATVFTASLNILLPLFIAAIRKSNPSEKRNSQKNAPRESEQAPQQTTRFSSPIMEKSGLRILIISNNDNRLTSITDHFNDWGYDYTISRNCVQAFRHMLSRFQLNKFVSYTTVIVDQQGLDLDPISLAQLIKNESRLAGTRLICYKAPSVLHQQSQQLHQAGYAAFLESPLNKAQLFSALHGEQQQYLDSANIICLSEHRAHKKSKPKQGIILLADSASSERTTLSKALIQAGYKVLMVDDGDQALDALEEESVDLAIVNINLSIMSGTQVLKLHRFTTPYKLWVPFVFLSNENSADTLRLCRSIGVQACFFKPVIATDLLEMIPTLLTQHQSTDANLNHITPEENNLTHFQNASLLDHMTLLRLERLDSGITFINDLIKIFEAEGSVILRTMRQAVDRKKFGLFLDQAQILLDSAGQLGAFALYELNRKATRLRAYEFEYRGYEVLEEIEKTFNLTLQAYSHYLSQRAATLKKDRI